MHVHACVCLRFYPKEFRDWKTNILGLWLSGISFLLPAFPNVQGGSVGPGNLGRRGGGPVPFPGDGWGTVQGCPGCVDRGLLLPGQLTAACLGLHGRGWAGPSRAARTQGGLCFRKSSRQFLVWIRADVVEGPPTVARLSEMPLPHVRCS